MENVEIELSNVCRTCKCMEPNMKNVFESSENPDQIPRIDEMLMACAAVQVYLGDGLPQLMCTKCALQLRNCFIFKKQCEEVDTSLREVAKSRGEIKQEVPLPDNFFDALEKDIAKMAEVESTEGVFSMNGDTPVTTNNSICNSNYLNKNELYDYIQLLDNNQMLLTCRECSKHFTTLEGLKCHKRLHSGALLKCKFCEKEYTRKNHLERHEATHGKRKVHVCKICNKTLTRFEHLKRHLTTHLKEKPFTCKSCQRGFNRLEHLNNHAVRCKGDRVHICDICNKAFNREDSLEVHKKLHDNDQPVLPTLENLDNIEQHYYEIDYDKNMTFSDHSDNEDYFEPHIEVTETVEEKKEEDVAIIAVELTQNLTEAIPEEEDEDDDDDHMDAEPIDDHDDSEIENDDADDYRDEDIKPIVSEPKLEFPEDLHDIPLKGSDNDDEDSDSTHSEYLPSRDTPKKRGRGRPRKHPIVPKVPGRKRGRPPTRHLNRNEVKPRKLKEPKKEPEEEPSGEYNCPIPDCKQIFNRMSLLEKHAITHDGLKLHTCSICTKKFTRFNHLKRHLKSHSQDKPYSCEKCKKCFNRRDHLNQHLKLHERSKDYTCDICQKPFYKMDQLAKHQACKHGIGERPIGEKKYECHICNKAFTTEKYREIHVKAHSGEKQFQCRTCDKLFLSKSHLTEHMKFHNDHQKKFLCSECGQRFIRNDYLVIHMRRHRGEKPFKCKFCGKGFPRTTDLTVHERYHTGEKTHLCTICGRGFGRAYNLTVHMRTHTGEKPYQCTYCDAAFAQGNDLKAHVRRHTGERFHCELCTESFLMGYLLTQHKRTVHGLNVVSNIRRLNPIHKRDQDDPNELPPITIPLPKPVVADSMIHSQLAQLAVAQLHHMAQE